MDAAAERNQQIYEDMWSHYSLFPHDGWSVWREIEPYYEKARGHALEIGPGMFPHLPIEGTHFFDLSTVALTALRERGGLCVRAATPLPLLDQSVDLICLFEVLEHVDADVELMRELRRVLRPGGVVFFSCPMNPDYFTYYDKVVGHERRYRGDELRDKLRSAGLVIEAHCARHDYMAPWFGAVFGFGTRYLSRFTSRIVKHYLPKVAALPWTWKEGDDLSEAEQRGGLTARARLVG